MPRLKSPSCPRCGKLRTRRNTSRRKGGKLQGWCRACMREYRVAWRAHRASTGADVRYERAWHIGARKDGLVSDELRERVRWINAVLFESR